MVRVVVFLASVSFVAAGSYCTEKYSDPSFIAGCESCEKWHPGKVNECMTCGNKCWHLCEKEAARADCYKQGSDYLTCHIACITNHEYADPTDAAAAAAAATAAAASAGAPDALPTQCVLDGAEAGDELMDSALYTWAAIERCQKASSEAMECEIDASSAIKSITGMIDTVIKSIDKCGVLNTVNRKCGESSTDLVKASAGLAASAGEVYVHCAEKQDRRLQSPCGTVAPPAAAPEKSSTPDIFKHPLKLMKCLVNVKDSMKYLMKTINDISKMKKECDEGAGECVENAEKLVLALSGLGEVVTGIVGHCKPEVKLGKCAHAIAGLTHDLVEIAEAGKTMSVQCELPNGGKGPKVVKVPVVVTPNVPKSRLYNQDHNGNIVSSGSSTNLILAAFLPITAFVSFVGGRWHANRRSSNRALVLDEEQVE
jgi:hypothetical protein